MKNFGYAKNMSPDDYEYYSGGMALDEDVLTYTPKLWQAKQKKRNNRKNRYKKEATGLTSSEESAEEEVIIPKKNKKSGKKEYSPEQKAKLVARLKAGREKAKANRAKKKEVVEPKKEEIVVNNIEPKATPAPKQPIAPTPPPEPKPQTKKEPGLRDFLSAIESKWEKRMSAVEARHAKQLEAKTPPKPQPQPVAAPINIPPPRSLGRFQAARW